MRWPPNGVSDPRAPRCSHVSRSIELHGVRGAIRPPRRIRRHRWTGVPVEAPRSRRRRQPAFEQHREAAGEGRRIGQLLALDDARLVEQQPGELGQLLGRAGFADRGGEPLDQPVPRVELEDALGGGVELAVLLQQPLEMHVDVALVGDQADRAVGQPLGAAHVLDRVAERQLEDRDQAGELRRRLRLFGRVLLVFGRLDLVEIDAAAGRRFERLFLVGADRRRPRTRRSGRSAAAPRRRGRGSLRAAGSSSAGRDCRR